MTADILRYGDWRPRVEPTGMEGEPLDVIAEAVAWLDQPGPEPLPSAAALALVHRQHRILRRNHDRAEGELVRAQVAARERNRDAQAHIGDALRSSEGYAVGYQLGSVHEIEIAQAALMAVRDELTNTEPA